MKTELNQIVLYFMMIITGTLTLTDEQIKAINNIIMGMPSTNAYTPLPPLQKNGETICGLTELAQLLGVSLPTACKLSRSGRFDAARLNYGTRKIVWDKKKLMEIGKSK